MNLRQFDLNLLVALDVLLTERNVTRAGERLFLSQSAVSGIFARLRHAFQDELLVRVGRNLELTAFAADLAGPVRDCVRQVEDLLNLRRPFEPESARWSFRIAASDYVVFLVLGALLKSLNERAPSVSVRFMALEPSAGERLAAGELDFAVLPAELEAGLPSLPLFEDSWVCAVWAGHPPLARAVHARRVPRDPASQLSPRGAGPWIDRRELPRAARLRAQDRRFDRELCDGAVPVARHAVRDARPAPARRAVADAPPRFGSSSCRSTFRPCARS